MIRQKTTIPMIVLGAGMLFALFFSAIPRAPAKASPDEASATGDLNPNHGPP
ncbi:MAG: hypothetical protein JRH13_00690 [Deltaproteobacteria bacterium]|nr:hypothetical protein [Deltaproteobacteria bacterium]